MALPIRNARIKLSQGQMFWREVGRGEALIFLHGSWQGGEQWLPIAEQLSSTYHCLVPDLLGFGESERSSVHYSVDLEVESLAEYAEALRLKDFYLVGHSLGGWIAASYALKFPDQVKGLILLAPEGVEVEAHRRRWLWSRWLTGKPPVLLGLLKFLKPLARLLGRSQGIERSLQHYRTLMQAPTACELLFQRRHAEIQAESLQERLAWLKTSTLLLQGEGDRSIAVDFTHAYAQAPEAELLLIPDADADVLKTHPGVVATHIHQFVEAH